LGKLRQQPSVPLAKRGRRQLGYRYLRQQGSDGCWQSSDAVTSNVNIWGKKLKKKLGTTLLHVTVQQV
jgi:hypothetical protein